MTPNLVDAQIPQSTLSCNPRRLTDSPKADI
jgi:hypothetical protein